MLFYSQYIIIKQTIFFTTTYFPINARLHTSFSLLPSQSNIYMTPPPLLHIQQQLIQNQSILGVLESSLIVQGSNYLGHRYMYYKLLMIRKSIISSLPSGVDRVVAIVCSSTSCVVFRLKQPSSCIDKYYVIKTSLSLFL